MQLRSLIAAAALLSASLVARADFTFSFTGVVNSGSGTFFTTTTGTAGEYLVTGVTGTIDGSSITLLAPGTYPGSVPSANDNLLFYPLGASPSYVDDAGVSVETAAGLYVNLFYDPVFFYVADYGNSVDGAFLSDFLTSFTLTPIATAAATPEPSSLVLLGTGVLGLAGAVRRRLA